MPCCRPEGPTSVSDAPSTVAGQAVVVSVPGGTQVNGGTASIGLTVAPAATPAGAGAVAGTAYEFGPDGTVFSAPVTLTVPYDPAALGGVSALRLRLYRLTPDGRLELLGGSGVDTQGHTVSGLTDHFSVYVVAEQVGTVDIVQPALALAIGQSATLDASIDQPGRVVVWASTDPAVATVADDGTVTAVGAGVAAISATSEGQADQVSVHRRQPAGRRLRPLRHDPRRPAGRLHRRPRRDQPSPYRGPGQRPPAYRSNGRGRQRNRRDPPVRLHRRGGPTLARGCVRLRGPLGRER